MFSYRGVEIVTNSKTYQIGRYWKCCHVEFSRGEIGNLLECAYCLKFISATFHWNAQITCNALQIFFRSPSEATRFEQSDLLGIRCAKQYFLVSNFATWISRHVARVNFERRVNSVITSNMFVATEDTITPGSVSSYMYIGCPRNPVFIDDNCDQSAMDAFRTKKVDAVQ